jgi:hypothetical protein
VTPEMVALGRRAVACRGWRWLPGMLTLDGLRVCRVEPEAAWHPQGSEEVWRFQAGTAIPDLSDGPTRGALLDLVREAWGDPTIHMHALPGGRWRPISATHGQWTWGGLLDRYPDPATEAEALVAALEAAP